MTQPSTVWVDQSPVDPGWQPPGTDEQPRRRLTDWLPVGIPVVIVVLVIALVAAFGGFKQRTDEVIRLQPGTTFEAGPYVFSFQKATVQKVEGYGEQKVIQEVIVYGSARNTWTEAILPSADQFAGSDLAGSESIEGNYVSLTAGRFSYLTPGLPAQDLQIKFEFSGDFAPGKELRFLTSDQTYGDHSFLGVSSEETWFNQGDRYLQNLPVTRLAAEET